MSSFLQQLLFILYFLQNVTSAIIKSVNLTTSNTNQNGASISKGLSNYAANDVQVNNGRWDIDVGYSNNAQRGYHLEMNLDNTWGFHPTKQSMISFTLYSTTPTPSANDLDLLISFSVNDNDYITFWIALDDTYNSVYPDYCDTKSIPTQSLGSGDVKTCVDSSWCNGMSETTRDCKATNDCRESAILPENWSMHQNQWPLTINIINNPVTHQVQTIIQSPHWGAWTQGCKYGESFATNVGAQIYVALDDAYEEINFYGFYIEYQYDTDNPTPAPTNNPTLLPTNNPSMQPTNIPTETPTSIPWTYETIFTIWDNSNIEGPPQGWLFIANNVVTDYTYVTTYGGPFGKTSQGTDPDTYYLSQSFYCGSISTVHIKYYMISCHASNGDYLQLFINNQSTGIKSSENSHGSIADLDLNHICTTWNWQGPFDDIIPLVQQHSLFNIVFETQITHSDAYIAIQGLSIECDTITPFPTIYDPTVSPITNAPTTYNPTISPTTNAPSTTAPTTPIPTTQLPTTHSPTIRSPTNGLITLQPTAFDSTETPTVSPTDGGQGSVDSQYSTQSDSNDGNGNGNKSSFISLEDNPNMIYYAIGMVVLLVCVCCIIFIFLVRIRRRKNMDIVQSIRSLSDKNTMKRVQSASNTNMIMQESVNEMNIISSSQYKNDDYLLPSTNNKETRLPPPQIQKQSTDMNNNIEMTNMITPQNDGIVTDENTNEDITDEEMEILDEINEFAYQTPNYESNEMITKGNECEQVTSGENNNPNLGNDEFIIGSDMDSDRHLNETEGTHKLNVNITPN